MRAARADGRRGTSVNPAAGLLRSIFRIFLRLEVRGLEHLAAAGPRCVIAVNHASSLDAPVIFALTGGDAALAVSAADSGAWWAGLLRRAAHVIAPGQARPTGVRDAVNSVKAGGRLAVFVEGRQTLAGPPGEACGCAAMIADRAGAVIVAARMEGLERSVFARGAGGKAWRLFPKARVTFLAPRRLTIDDALRGRARRAAAAAGLFDIMSDLIFATSDYEKTLIRALRGSVRLRGAGRIIVEDPVSGPLSGRTLLISAAVLARKIMALTGAGETVGLLLPNANGAAVTFFAVQAAGRVPAMLNYTAGPANLVSACKTARVRIVLSSRAFVEKGGLTPVIAELEKHVRLVWLEDLRKSIGAFDKLRGALGAGRALSPRQPGDPAAVLFTSGSEGAPKGVVLSHRNLNGNVAQIMARFDITARDTVFNALPVFHSFGMTGGMLLPLLTGMRLYLYPSPLHYRQIPELVRGAQATVLFGTDTFLNGYARMAKPDDFRSLRYIVAGAEPVRAETRRLYLEKFGLGILEGYGVTETAPVLAVNAPMFSREGTVGRLMPGVEHRLEDVPGISGGGRLHVRGPNVMLGYYRAENPGVLEPAEAGWHDTGDICAVDELKFVTIRGRAKRFAKIAGEMVSLAGVEQLCADLWPEHAPAVVAVPDARKGERLVMVTTQNGARRADVQAHMKAKGAPEIMAPAEIMVVDALPLLGSGKTDYVMLDALVRGRPGLAGAV